MAPEMRDMQSTKDKGTARYRISYGFRAEGVGLRTYEVLERTAYHEDFDMLFLQRSGYCNSTSRYCGGGGGGAT